MKKHPEMPIEHQRIQYLEEQLSKIRKVNSRFKAALIDIEECADNAKTTLENEYKNELFFYIVDNLHTEPKS